MPLTCICGTIGALAISSFPWTSGFISKSMISQAAADEHLVLVWLFLMAASAGVFLHAGIKFPWFVFFQKNSGLRPPDPPLHMRAAMVLFAAFCIGLGLFPGLLYSMLPYPVDYEPYTVAHVVNMLQLLLFSGLAFFLLLPMMKRTLTVTLDFDWLYRRLIPGSAKLVADNLSQDSKRVSKGVRAWLSARSERLEAAFGEHSALARAPGTMVMVVTVVAVFGALLIRGFQS
jgi:multicomponent Na+:H+ antiporter subunit D